MKISEKIAGSDTNSWNSFIVNLTFELNTSPIHIIVMTKSNYLGLMSERFLNHFLIVYILNHRIIVASDAEKVI